MHLSPTSKLGYLSFKLTCKCFYELNMWTENYSHIFYLLQTFWFKAINFTFIHSLIHNITNDSLTWWFQESSGDVEVLSAGQSAINLWVKLSNLMSYFVNHISIINLSFSEFQRFSMTKLITLCPSSFWYSLKCSYIELFIKYQCTNLLQNLYIIH